MEAPLRLKDESDPELSVSTPLMVSVLPLLLEIVPATPVPGPLIVTAPPAVPVPVNVGVPVVPLPPTVIVVAPVLIPFNVNVPQLTAVAPL